jgi:adenine-specific DNA-methyltransferase
MFYNNQTESRFIELMAELFQLDEAEALDFGLYRIIRRHNQEVREFLGEIVIEGDRKILQGGRLSVLLDEAFAALDAEVAADDKYRTAELEKQLGIRPGMNTQERERKLWEAETFPFMVQVVADYRARLENRAAAATATMDRTEVLNRLYQFFSRHYQDGDFIVERRYGRDGSRYIRSTGEDTEFHWATEDMYYIKSGDIFTDFPVTLSTGQRLVFTVEPEMLQATRAALKPNDKAHYELEGVIPGEDGRLRVSLKYLKGAQSDKQKEAIAMAVQQHGGGDAAEIKRWLSHFIARNQSDFFIHKRLKEALAEDLDIFIKTDVLNADQLLTGGDLPGRVIKVARIVREVGGKIIDFLAALEDFQKALWEKKKLVFATRYVITLDRIEKLVGRDWLEARIDQIVQRQREEWQALGLGDYAAAIACRIEKAGDLLTETTHRYLPLPVDTALFDDDFKWSLLEAVSREQPLDEALDGVAVHSDNWQALNSLEAKYRERVKCIYIDPPYNTNASGIPYKNGYRHASWGTLMHNRIIKLHLLLPSDGALFVSIDKVERTLLEKILDSVFSADNRIEELIWVQNTNNGRAPTYSTNHEYIQIYAKHRPTVEQEVGMFREPKPGYEEMVGLVSQLNPGYPSVAQIEAEIRSLFNRHRAEYRDQVESQGLDWEEEKSNDPWRGLYNYRRAEYRDANGKLVSEDKAREGSARIWIWREDNISIMSAEAKQSETIRDPNHPNYRFYQPTHPITGKLCPAPKGGFKYTQFENPDAPERNSFATLNADHRIVWGPDETKMPQLKRILHEVETNVSKSVFRDFADGEKQTSAMFGKAGVFLAPKHTDFVSRFILQASRRDSFVLDCFGGSGSTAHAVINVNRLEKSRRKFITVEVNKYFESLIVPRLKKAGAAVAWAAGKAKGVDGPGLFMRVQILEQYEDTLENLDTELASGQSGEFDFDDPAFGLRYRLDRESRAVFCAIERFVSPFGYRLKRAEGGGEAQPQPVDLVESLVYLLGLDVARLYREPQGVVVTGHDRRGRSVAVFFRDCDKADSARWVQAKLAEHPTDRVLTNDPAALAFEGCERFEAIETAFASQFRRA